MTTIQTSWQYQHAIIEAAQERGWTVTFIDARAGVIVLEEPYAGGVVLRLTGRDLSSTFIRALPEARQPEERS